MEAPIIMPLYMARILLSGGMHFREAINWPSILFQTIMAWSGLGKILCQSIVIIKGGLLILKKI